MNAEQLDRQRKLQRDVEAIVNEAPDLADLTCNSIKEKLVAVYGRSWLNENFGYLRRCVREILVQDVYLRGASAEVYLRAALP